MISYHQSVLKDEVTKYLSVKPGAKYIDATAGGGGHSEEIARLGGHVLAIDRDSDATNYLRAKNIESLTVVQGNFSHIDTIAKSYGYQKVSGILFDLGVSSHQLDTSERGFSFTKDGPLDMRMDTEEGITAFDIINNFDKRRLNEIFKSFGEEQLSLAIADAIVGARQIKPPTTTKELSTIVSEVYGRKHLKTKLHPATKVFQALRIVVNSELINLEEALPQTTSLLNEHGRLVIVSFHSLEDQIVKRFLKGNSDFRILTKKPIGPNASEIAQNPRSRSAKLRAAEKVVD